MAEKEKSVFKIKAEKGNEVALWNILTTKDDPAELTIAASKLKEIGSKEAYNMLLAAIDIEKCSGAAASQLIKWNNETALSARLAGEYKKYVEGSVPIINKLEEVESSSNEKISMQAKKVLSESYGKKDFLIVLGELRMAKFKEPKEQEYTKVVDVVVKNTKNEVLMELCRNFKVRETLPEIERELQRRGILPVGSK